MPKIFYQSSLPVSIPQKKPSPQYAQNSYPVFFSPKQEEAAKESERAESLMHGVDPDSPLTSLPLSSCLGS